MIRVVFLLFVLSPVLWGQAVTNLAVQEISSHGVSVEYQMTGSGWSHATLWGDPDASDSELDFVQGFHTDTTTGANRYLRFVGGTAGASLSLSVALLNNPASVNVLPLGGSGTDANVVYHVTCSGTTGCTNCTSADQTWAADDSLAVPGGSGLNCSTTDGSWPTLTMAAESGLGATAPVLTGIPDWETICDEAEPVTEVATWSALQTAFAAAYEDSDGTNTKIPVTPGEYETSARWDWIALGTRGSDYICVESTGELPEWGASATLAHWDDWVRIKPTGHFLQRRSTNDNSNSGVLIHGRTGAASRVHFRGVAITQPPIAELPKTVCTVDSISGNELTVSGCDPVAAGWGIRARVILDLPGMDLITNYPIESTIEDFIGNCSGNVCLSSTKVVLETSEALSGQASYDTMNPGTVTMAMGHTITNITHDGTKLQVDFDSAHGYSQDLVNDHSEQVALLRIQIDGSETSGSWFAEYADADSLFLCDAASGACTSSALGTYSASDSDYMLTRNRGYSYGMVYWNGCDECAWTQGGYISPRLGPYNPQNLFSFSGKDPGHRGSNAEFSGNLVMEAVWREPIEPGSTNRGSETFPEQIDTSGINSLLITGIDTMRVEGNTFSGMGTAQVNAQNTGDQVQNVSITKNVFRQNESYWTDYVGSKFGTPGVTASNRHGGGIEFKTGCLNCLVEGNVFSGNLVANDGNVTIAPVLLMTHTVDALGPFVATELAINYNIFERVSSGLQLTGASSNDSQRNWAPFRALDIIGNVFHTNYRYANTGQGVNSAGGMALGILRTAQHLRVNDNSFPLQSGDGPPFWIMHSIAHGQFDSNIFLYPAGTGEAFFVNESSTTAQVRPWAESTPPEKWTTWCAFDCDWTSNQVLAGIDESTFWTNHTDSGATRADCNGDIDDITGDLAAGTTCIQNATSFKTDWQTIYQGDYSAGTMTHERQAAYASVGADVDEIWRRHGLPQNVVMNRTSATAMEIGFDAPHASETWVLKVSCDSGSTWSEASDSAAQVARTISVGSLGCSTGVEWRLEGPGRTVTGVEP